MNDPQPEGHMASYIRRRHFLATLLGGAAAWPLATRAQQRPGKVARIGFLGVGPASAWADSVEALRAGLRDLRHVEGKDIIIDLRWAERIDQLPELAAELVHMDVDIIIAPASTEVEPARQATKTIPIVFTQHADPVGIGHVASLARPGGNITEMSAHRLPGIFANKANVEAGGLMSYGADFNYMYRHAALYVDKILNGEKPADLPVEQASRYELAIKS